MAAAHASPASRKVFAAPPARGGSLTGALRHAFGRLDMPADPFADLLREIDRADRCP